MGLNAIRRAFIKREADGVIHRREGKGKMVAVIGVMWPREA